MRLVFFGPGVSAGLRGVRESKPHPLNRRFRRVLVEFRLSRLCRLEREEGRDLCVSEERRREANERSAGAVRARLRTQRDTCEKIARQKEHREARTAGWTARSSLASRAEKGLARRHLAHGRAGL